MPTGILNTNSNENFDNSAFRQKLDLTYKLKIDSSSDLKLSADGTIKTFNVNNNYTTAIDSSGTLLNRTNRSVINSGTENKFDVSALYTKQI